MGCMHECQALKHSCFLQFVNNWSLAPCGSATVVLISPGTADNKFGKSYTTFYLLLPIRIQGKFIANTTKSI